MWESAAKTKYLITGRDAFLGLLRISGGKPPCFQAERLGTGKGPERHLCDRL